MLVIKSLNVINTGIKLVLMNSNVDCNFYSLTVALGKDVFKINNQLTPSCQYVTGCLPS